MRKIVDCIMFYNELDMLEFRLDYLSEVVDFFVISEANKTHVGKEKPLFLKENLHRFERYLDKMVLVECESLEEYDPSLNAWINESRHRQSISEGIGRIELNPSDVILVSDVDEIPDAITLKEIKESGIKGLHTFVQDFYYYNIGCKISSRWKFPKAADFETYKTFGPQRMRMATFEESCKEIERGGWHFSYFGPPEFIRNKIENFAHQEFNSEEFKDIERIKSRVGKRENIFDDQKFEFIEPSENPYLPAGYQKLLEMAEVWNPNFIIR